MLSLDGTDNFACFRETPGFLLGIHERAIHGDLENAAASLYNFNTCSFKPRLDFVRQTDGLGLVVSHSSIKNRYSHG